MAKFEARGAAVFQLPDGGKMGFLVCQCDNGCGDAQGDEENAEEIARCLNQDDAIKELATWLLKQKTLHINKERVELLERIIEGK